MPVKAVLSLSIAVVSFAVVSALLAPHPQTTALKLYVGMSEPEARVFEKACKDCHSNDTDWPWYSKIPPISLGVAADVRKGRKAWNISDWEVYSRGKRVGFLSAIAIGAAGDRMPPQTYRLMHRASRLNADERILLAKWAAAERSRLVASPKPFAAK